MRTTKRFVLAFVVLSSFPIFAQQTSAHVQQSASGSAAGSQIDASASASAQAYRGGVQAQGAGAANGSAAIHGMGSANGSAAGSAEFRPVQGELVSKLDSKSAKAGDPVVFKTTEEMRTAEGTEIPKGSRIVGHVTDVQAHSKGSEDSHLGIVFERAELKNGRSMPIHSVIESITPSASAMAAANNDSDLFASPMGGTSMGGGFAGGGVAIGGTRSGGMLGGGAASGAGSLAVNGVHTVGSVAGNSGANLGSTMNGTVAATGSTAANAGANLRGTTLNGATAGNGLLSAHPTGVPGLMLAGDASLMTSGTLLASRRNVHLDSGTQMVLGVSSVLAQ